MKQCAKCKRVYALSTENFYVQRARRKGKPDGWGAYCKSCWKQVNAETKLRIKLRG